MVDVELVDRMLTDSAEILLSRSQRLELLNGDAVRPTAATEHLSGCDRLTTTPSGEARGTERVEPVLVASVAREALDGLDLPAARAPTATLDDEGRLL